MNSTMHIFLYFLSVLVIVVSANPRKGEGPEATVNGYLIRRAQSIQLVLESNISQLKAQGNDKLASTLEVLLELVKKKLQTLQTNQDLTTRHVTEEDLERLQNRVMEELIAIEVAKHHVPKSHTAEILIQQAEELIKCASNAVKNVPPHDRDYASTQHEIQMILDLVRFIKGQPTGADLRKQEIQLVKHEQTLKVLLDRLSSHAH